MAFVSVPKDLAKVKNKVLFNLTKRQLVCLLVAAVTGLPFYFFTKTYIGTGSAATGMVFLMLPAFLFAMYEKDGLPLEKVLKNIVEVKLKRPAIRRYEVKNLYEIAKEQKLPARRKGGKTSGGKKRACASAGYGRKQG